MKISFICRASEPVRLDSLISAELVRDEKLSGFSRSQIKRWIEHGLVLVGGETARKAGAEVRPGASVSIEVPESWYEAKLKAESLPLAIVHEDETLIVIDKPAGMTVHPGAGQKSGTLLNALIGHFGTSSRGLPEVLQQMPEFGDRPGIVHRLDKDTTGLVVVAKTVAAQRALGEQFARHSIQRGYKALVLSTPRARRPVNVQAEGVVDAPLLRHAQRREQFTVDPQGRRAVTHWRVIERMSYGSLLELRLETGRTHQIRVHMNHLGCPVVGDRVYGDFCALPTPLRRLHDQFGRQALHAYRLGFVHPESGKEVCFESSLPDDMKELIARFKEYGA